MIIIIIWGKQICFVYLLTTNTHIVIKIIVNIISTKMILSYTFNVLII